VGAGREWSVSPEERVKQILAGTVLGFWEVVNTLPRLRPSRRDRYRVTICVATGDEAIR
jgi:hypothetical protein